jgi:tetratricopeptide (TPR) repeat protein
MNKHEVAIKYYKKTILSGQNEPYYFAAKSALQIGLLYEIDNNQEEAKRYFNICIQMEDHQYEQGIEQKAKAGLNRLN